MLCSTIIPTINRPSLERAVKSALDQDLAPGLHEIIVVNDSGKPLPEVAWLQSPWVTVVNTNRCERSIACNVGAAVALGKYLKILHDDDYLLPGALRALTTVAERSGWVWVYGALNRVDNEDRFLSVDRPQVQGNLLAELIGGECLHPGASLIRRDAFLQAGGFDAQLKVREDYDLECRLALGHDFGRTDTLVVGVRIGRVGSTTQWERVTYEHRLVREKLLNTAGALARLLDAIQGDRFTRGRISRTYLYSLVLNVLAGRLFTAGSRLVALVRLAGLAWVWPDFWRGAMYLSHWHQVEKHKEDQHYAAHTPNPPADASIVPTLEQ
jgi:glycosyltransferase involved in cell wall biosynthesis